LLYASGDTSMLAGHLRRLIDDRTFAASLVGRAHGGLRAIQRESCIRAHQEFYESIFKSYRNTTFLIFNADFK